MTASIDIKINLRSTDGSAVKQVTASLQNLKAETRQVVSAYDAAEAALKRADREYKALIQSEIRAKVATQDFAGALALVDRELKSASPNTVQFNRLVTQQTSILKQASSAAQQASGGGGIGGLVTTMAGGATAILAIGKAAHTAYDSYSCS